MNDNATVAHVGCQAVSDGTARLLGAAGHEVVRRSFLGAHRHLQNTDAAAGVTAALSDPEVAASFAECDAVVVNGEGTIHHGAGTELLNILGAARAVGLPALLVNSVIQEVDGFDSVFRGLTDLTVRDGYSLAALRDRGISARLVADTFLSARFDPEPLIDLSGNVVATCWHHARDVDTGRQILQILCGLAPGTSWFLPFLCRDTAECWKQIPSTIAPASAVLTGRHHAVYCALLTGTPFVALGSNTWKMEGLVALAPELADYICPADPAAALASAISRRDEFAYVSERLKSAPPPDPFRSLGIGSSEGGAVGAQREIGRLARDLAREISCRPAPDLVYRLRRRSCEVIHAGQAAE